MTRNQIEYQKLLELKRSNRANEAITSTRDNRSAIAKEFELNEVARSNRARESETQRHNMATENQALANLGVAMYEADTHRQQADEAHRSNIAHESETARHNLASERESKRSNLANEAERARSNRVQEQIAMDRNYYQNALDAAKANVAAQEVGLRREQTITEQKQRDKIASEIETNTAKKSQLEADADYKTANTSYTKGKNIRENIGMAIDLLGSVGDISKAVKVVTSLIAK